MGSFNIEMHFPKFSEPLAAKLYVRSGKSQKVAKVVRATSITGAKLGLRTSPAGEKKFEFEIFRSSAATR